MTSAELLTDSFGRIQEIVEAVLDGLKPEHLTVRLDSEANTIAWLVWHLTRIQDDHVAHAAGSEQVWTAQGWAQRFDLPFEPPATGCGHSPAEFAAVRVGTAGLLSGYHDAVHARTVAYVGGLTDGDLSRVVDT